MEEKEGTRVIVIYADGEMKRGTVYSLPSPSDNGFWINPVNPVNPDGKESQRIGGGEVAQTYESHSL